MATPTSVRGRLVPPDLDDRQWTDLVAEARALIPTYAPQWTDHNPSDVGMTLVELFAWLVEGMIYRLNRVPEKNYVAFLNLLGITRDPATPAHAFLTFTANPAGGAVTVAKGRQAQTQEREGEQPFVFETDTDVVVLPANLKGALLVTKVGGALKYSNVTSTLISPPALGQIITIPAGQSVTLCLGFDQLPAQDVRLLADLVRPVRLVPGGTPEALVDWHFSSGVIQPSAWSLVPIVTDDTDGLQHAGSIVLTPPAGWTSQNPTLAWPLVTPNSPADTLNATYWWLGVRIANLTAAPIDVGLRYLLFNAVSSFNALTAAAETATGTGKPNQIVALAHQPIFKRLGTDTPYDHLVVRVGGVPWTQVDDLPAGPSTSYILDPVAGEVRFGDYSTTNTTGHGAIPAAGAVIDTPGYRYVAAGAAGNVGAGTVTAMRTPVAGIIGVTNVFSAFGGSDEEPIEDTKRRAPQLLRTRDRAVTAEDYEYLAREATTDVAIVRCLEPRLQETDNPGHWLKGDPWTFGALDRRPGNVHVIVVPDYGTAEARPQPSPDLVQEVLRYLDKRRVLTSRLHVTGPRYLPVIATCALGVWQRAIDGGLTTLAGARLALEARIRAFLHPVHGGLDRLGWQVGQHVFMADLYKAVMPADDIGFISSLALAADIPLYHFPPLGPGGAWSSSERPFVLALAATAVRVADYELVCDTPGAHVITATAIT
ncbi:MAG TPA: baseplate J/gp47 family protein [Gemmatimonadaceae bacterium]|nr:baseplate J/gp47 family protein [Gemmatimonadaceae bacterium]